MMSGNAHLLLTQEFYFERGVIAGFIAPGAYRWVKAIWLYTAPRPISHSHIPR